VGTELITRVLDSVVLIDHLNGVRKASEFLDNLQPAETAISVITRAEILCGIDESQEPLVKALLDQYKLLIIDGPIADSAARLRKEHRFKLADAFQAALAISHGIKLATRNTKDFNPRKHSFVEIPYSL
jgi:predicted nucleic acid-binding protein